ncbi:MAG: hypothetical protein JWN30_2868 [Bacilli bacterium]|nr:hypothetical protein [Bacilli bacterium]
MTDTIIMYDEVEQTTTRYVGIIGDQARFDLMIVTTGHFFGKYVVTCLQTARSAILNLEEADDAAYLAQAFALSETEAEELSEFLGSNLI